MWTDSLPALLTWEAHFANRGSRFSNSRGKVRGVCPQKRTGLSQGGGRDASMHRLDSPHITKWKGDFAAARVLVVSLRTDEDVYDAGFGIVGS
jgi:hypothetical protein